MSDIINQLHQLDLNGRQARIYLALLQLGSAGAIEIAKYTKFKHPTVYDVLDDLKERRLVTETMTEGRKLFHAENPDNLQWEIDRRQSVLSALLPDLKTLYQGGEHHTRLHFYEGAEGGDAIRRELLSVREKRYYYFGSVQDMFKLTSNEVEEEFFRIRLRRGIWSYSIRNRAKEVPYDYMKPGDRYLRKVRYLPKPLADNVSGLYFYDDKVAVTSALKENYTFILESRELNVLVHALWDYMWEICEEP